MRRRTVLCGVATVPILGAGGGDIVTVDIIDDECRCYGGFQY